MYGSSMKPAMDILDKLSIEYFQRRVSTQLSQNDDSYICHKCKQKIEDLPELLSKAEQMKEELINKIRKLMGRKRNATVDDEDNEVVTPKRNAECTSVYPEFETTSTSHLCTTNVDDGHVTVRYQYDAMRQIIFVKNR
jgi:hypothetical protein